MIYTEDFFLQGSNYPADNLVQLVDSYTKENVNYVKYTGAGSIIDDGVIFRAKGSEWYVLSNYISGEYVNVKQFGAKGDGINNDSLIINYAIEVTSRLKMRLFIPKTDHFYMIDPQILTFDESTVGSPDIHVGMLIQSNMDVFSDGAVLKLKDGISSEAAPKAIRMFFSNDFLHDISMSGLVLDMNGLNNLITPKIVTYRKNEKGEEVCEIMYSLLTQFHFGFSGTKDGVACGADNVLIENCSFINTAGVTCISMCQSNKVGVKLGRNWIIRNNLFKNNGLDSTDHSSIFGWATDVNCYNNTFYNDVMPEPVGGRVAYEVHGSNQNFFNNTIENYYQGLWVGINNSEDKIQNIYIHDNVFSLGCVFVDFYNGNLEGDSSFPVDIENVFIKSNVGTITNRKVKDEVKQLIRINAKKAPSNVFVENNTLINESYDKPCSFFSGICDENQINGMDRIFINNNSGVNLDIGCVFYWGKIMDLGMIHILNNSFEYKNNFGFDISCYGNVKSQQGKILDLKVSNIKSFYSDNNNRAVISGDFSFQYNNMSLSGVSLEDGSFKSNISSSKNHLTVNAELRIGSTTSFDGYPIAFKVNGAASNSQTICDAVISKSLSRYLVKGVVDATGSWCTLTDMNGNPINSADPVLLSEGTVVNSIFVIDNSKLTV
ncbi:hypothetical protein [Chryseobacterium sp. BIGb0232]|uniref:hypothetical protein n=1 Tax=Chryseobacterium sp. BIGb0232 TaxID=2940598 RepID=UPI000F49303F|nr:hypothetical protein [Chryseobacterium sp. BIGb0232]MCS4301131.1 hypothetical protein [Chryseobacterium sp. BIGb0232]ROS20008.1 hypothetical protein EDF65_0709 [Chryseobacterium nakagawai]